MSKKIKSKKLSLNRDTLRRLDGELASVVGGFWLPSLYTCPTCVDCTSYCDPIKKE
jgi:hypothetical protein